MHKILEELAKVLAKEILAELQASEFFERKLKTDSDRDSKLLSTKEASKHFDVHMNTIRNWIKLDELPSKRIGNKLYVKLNTESNEKRK